MREYKEYKELGKINESMGFDLELALATRVLGLESLHHGYWKDDEELTLKNLKIAQERYTDKIIASIPPNVKTILDVGCGIGDIAARLATEGYVVTSLSPIEDHEKQYMLRNGDNENKFVLSKYEDLDINERFDLVLMAESSNYIDLEKGMLQTKRFIAEDGYLLVFGIFGKIEDEKFNRFSKKRFVSEALNVGLSLIKEEEITSKTVKTLRFAHSIYDQYVPALVDVLKTFYQKVFSLKTKIVSMFFRKELRLLDEALTKVVPMRIDPSEFQKHFSYEILLFEASSEKSL